MPELPEITALVTDLGARLTGRAIDRVDILSFAALKTFDPPVSGGKPLADRVLSRLLN